MKTDSINMDFHKFFNLFGFCNCKQYNFDSGILNNSSMKYNRYINTATINGNFHTCIIENKSYEHKYMGLEKDVLYTE